MSNALLSAVSGLKAHQEMLDVAGNNLANVNTTAYKSTRVTFSDLLNETMKEASQPTATVGGMNPQQIGSGVQVATVDRNMSQGSLVNTGQSLDMAIDGSGFFVLNNGSSDVYTRVGAFSVDAGYYLVDPGTGYRVQRVGSEGVTEGFQDPTNNAIRIPYDFALPAHSTSTIGFNGNLSSDTASVTGTTTNLLSAGMIFSQVGGGGVSEATLLGNVEGAHIAVGDKFHIQGTLPSGAYIGGAAAGVTYTVAAGDTLNTLLTQITNAMPGARAVLSNSEIRVVDDNPGYSQTMLKLSYEAASGHTTGAFPLPNFFQVVTAGAPESKIVNIEVYDSQGVSHILTGTFVRREVANQWDFVVNNVTGNVQLGDRRINGIKFLPDGSFGGVTPVTQPDGSTAADHLELEITYPNDPTNLVTLDVNLGSVGQFDGLSQFGGASTAASSGQDGYASGWLSSVSVGSEGVLVGVFTNGIRRDLAAIKVATFQNPEGLQSVGGNYYTATTNSGDPVPTKALSGGAGSIHGGSLEKSNVDVAEEFVNLMQAQNGFQANARTIRVANEILHELTNLMQ
jgi:flagellar hook protein FlgE